MLWHHPGSIKQGQSASVEVVGHFASDGSYGETSLSRTTRLFVNGDSNPLLEMSITSERHKIVKNLPKSRQK
jgi:hypothetical protein